jgi:hypothetical protein
MQPTPQSPVPAPRRAARALSLIVGAALLLAAAPAAASSADPAPSVPVVSSSDPFDPTIVRTFAFTMERADWDAVRADLSYALRRPAELRVDDAEPLLVEVRRKSSRALPSESDPRKVGLKVKVDGYVSGQRWLGLNTLSLENGGDISPVDEGFQWNLHELASVDGFYGSGYGAGRANWVLVTMTIREHVDADGTVVPATTEVLGVHTSVEQRNKRFLSSRGIPTAVGATWLWKQSDIGPPEQEVGEGLSPHQVELCYVPFGTESGTSDGGGKGGKGGSKPRAGSTCAKPADDTALRAQLDRLVDMDRMLTLAAVEAYANNHDGMMTKGKNFFFLDRVESGTVVPRTFYPWDLDTGFNGIDANVYAVGTSAGGKGRRTTVTYTQSAYQQLILNHPWYRQRYDAILLGLLDGPLAASELHAFLDAVEPSLAAAFAQDPYQASGIDAIARLRQWIDAREPRIRAQVSAGLPAPRA